jgi:prepilin-type N-terminal cleavage/methylation domain-containing protein/prepilin-type processing-associated H-X9-DG protein
MGEQWFAARNSATAEPLRSAFLDTEAEMTGATTLRRAFTLVELLVVIAIIGTLVALLLPAVNSARESARKMSCSNNIRNLSLAIQQYHDTMGRFPSAFIDSPTNLQENWGWGALILPYLEQQALHKNLGVITGSFYSQLAKGGAEGRQVIEAAQTPLKIFMCPSDAGVASGGLVVNNRGFHGGLGYAANNRTTAGESLVAVSNYMVTAGHRDVVGATVNTGFAYGSSNLKYSHITDGTSNTFMLGERDTEFCKSGTWVGVRATEGSQGQGVGAVLGHSHPKLNQPDPPIGWNTNRTGCGEGFSSFHPGGAQFAFCDGSVRFISQNINHYWYPNTIVNGTDADSKNTRNGTYQRLMTRSDKLTPGDF